MKLKICQYEIANDEDHNDTGVIKKSESEEQDYKQYRIGTSGCVGCLYMSRICYSYSSNEICLKTYTYSYSTE